MLRHPDQEPAEIPVVQLFLSDEKLNQLWRRCEEGYGTFQVAGQYASDVDQEWFPDFHDITLNAEPSLSDLESSHHLDMTVYPNGQVRDITQLMNARLFTSKYDIQFEGDELEYYSVGTEFVFSTTEQIPSGLRLNGANKVYGFIYQMKNEIEAHVGIHFDDVKLYWTLRIVNGKSETERSFIGQNPVHDYNFDAPPSNQSDEYQRLLSIVKPIFEEMRTHLELGYQQIIFRTEYQDRQTTFTVGSPSQRTLEGAISRLLIDQKESNPVPLIVPLKIIERKES